MGNSFEKEVQRLETKQNRQFDALDAWLKQMEVAQGAQPQSVASLMMPMDSGTSTSDSSVPAPENCLLLAAQLAAANPAQQNPKLVSHSK